MAPDPIDVPPPSAALRAAFSAAQYAPLASSVVHQLQAMLAGAAADPHPTPLPWRAPAEQLAAWAPQWSREPVADLPASFEALVQRALAASTNIQSPGFVAHQVAPALPLAALCDAVAAQLNNGTAVYEMGPASTAMELHVIRWMTDTLGLGAAAGGVLTSGGTLATLTALLAARQARAGWDIWDAGDTGGPPLAILVSEQAHYCADRAVRIMGWGGDGVIRIPVDADYRLRPECLADGMARAAALGRRVIAVVGSACTTATGSFDPLEPIADFCQAHGLWFHVDGAHGASFILSDADRHRLAGIERADSVIWDAHKMLMMPALITGVLFRDARHAASAFAQDASYLLEGRGEEEWYNLASRTFECTKRMMSFKLYAALALHGTGLFAEYVARTAALARAFAARVAAAPDFELAVAPQCNIVCFRHRPPGVTDPAERSAWQVALRQRIIEGGRFYPVQTRLHGETWLRLTLMNPFTTLAHLDALLSEMRQ